MKNIYIFTIVPDAYAPKRFIEECAALGHMGKIIDYNDIQIEVANGTESKVYLLGEELPQPDAVILRANMFLAQKNALLHHFAHHGVPILNKETLLKWPMFDKCIQHMQMHGAGIPIVPSIIVKKPKTYESHEFPFIMKSAVGSHGSKVFKIESQADLDSLSDEDAPYLAQPFLHAGKDVRVIVIGGEARGAMLRTAQAGNFLTNYSVGGSVSELELIDYPDVKKIAEETAAHFACDYAGIDLMQDDSGSWIVLEVNRQSQFEGFEKSTGVNIAKLTLEQLL